MIENHFPPRPTRAPIKRFRGKKRYYRRVVHKAQTFSLSLADGDWYDSWHYHADWPGYGNLGWKHRRTHVEALCMVFRNITQQLQGYSKPYQLWLYLNLEDAGQDAVFFHTPSPQSHLDSHSRFPLQLPNVRWGFQELEELLSTWLAPLPLRAGVETWNGNNYIYIYSLAHGLSFE